MEKIAPDFFRSVFKVVDKEALRWFPGHMDKGLKQMQQKLRSVDCIIEVHDARIPLSGKNLHFKHTIMGIKPHILVLNKVDLIDDSHIDKIKHRLHNEYDHVIFTNCKSQKCKGVASLFPLAQEIIGKSDRYNRTGAEDYNVMIIGIPNVGKSSLVNALRVKHLRKGNASQVGAVPGITRSVLNRIKMSENPLFYMIDTPGILTPNVASTDVGLKLAVCATIQDHLVGETIIADYLLFWLNKNGYYDYANVYRLERPSDDILEVLSQICKNEMLMIKVRDFDNNVYVYKPNVVAAAKIMLRDFRSGRLGRIVLDADLL